VPDCRQYDPKARPASSVTGWTLSGLPLAIRNVDWAFFYKGALSSIGWHAGHPSRWPDKDGPRRGLVFRNELI